MLPIVHSETLAMMLDTEQRSKRAEGLRGATEMQPSSGRAGGARAKLVYGRDEELGVEYLLADDADLRFARHFHDTFSIGVIERGANGFFLHGARQIAPRGAICVVPPGEVHTGGEAGRFGYRNLYPDAALLAEVAADLRSATDPHGSRGEVPRFRSPVIDDPRGHALFLALFDAIARRAPRLERETRLLAALRHLVAHHAEHRSAPHPPQRDPAVVATVRAYLDAHVAEEVALADLAALTDRHRSYLVRAFHRAVGLPPHAYQRQRRVELAKRLVLAGTPLAQAATEAGFADQPHMTRRFRQILGVSPGRIERPRG